MASRLFAFGLLISIIAVFLPTSNEKSIGPTSTPSPTPSVGLCFLPQDSGICMAYFPRFYFNHKTKKCEKFIYGGCGGNQNNFLNKAACQFKCATISPQVGGILAKKSVLSTKKSVESRPAVGTPPKQSSVNNNTSISKTTPCLLQKKKALASNQTGLFLPECTQNGEYKTKQCWKPLGLTHTCWCVNKLGSKIGEVTKTANGIETCKSHRKTKREDSQCMRLVRMYHQNVPADHLKYAYIPQCDDYDGLFAIRQCFQDTCWCVDKHNGAVVKNSFGPKSTLSCTHA